IKVWWRSTFIQGSWNYERMQNGGWAYTLIPALKRLYHTKEDRSAALKRHLEFFNTHPYLASPIIGVTMALEPFLLKWCLHNIPSRKKRTGPMAIITLVERSQIELMQHHTIQYIAATLGRSRISIRHELHR
ncbi:PTS system mannose/fructose/sorbose family transporter subunit IID, partial [Lacticaseibacillus paracasei]|uniref:PTS system mannose/fructose/sorbose family transporter subunit IID n=1 Tax=Lacticaseibacillus paracasei TaxID=1597 RepID=UPI002A5A45DE